MRIRHFVLLVREFLAFSWLNGALWVIPVMLVLVIMMLAVTVGQAAAPFTLYTLF
jgi:hypothetical protein